VPRYVKYLAIGSCPLRGSATEGLSTQWATPLSSELRQPLASHWKGKTTKNRPRSGRLVSREPAMAGPGLPGTGLVGNTLGTARSNQSFILGDCWPPKLMSCHVASDRAQPRTGSGSTWIPTPENTTQRVPSTRSRASVGPWDTEESVIRTGT